MIILVDESNSMKDPNFDRVKKFLINIVRNIELGNSAKSSRISIITYSDEAYLAYQLNDTQNTRSVEKTILNMPFRTRKSQQNMASG